MIKEVHLQTPLVMGKPIDIELRLPVVRCTKAKVPYLQLADFSKKPAEITVIHGGLATYKTLSSLVDKKLLVGSSDVENMPLDSFLRALTPTQVLKTLDSFTLDCQMEDSALSTKGQKPFVIVVYSACGKWVVGNSVFDELKSINIAMALTTPTKHYYQPAVSEYGALLIGNYWHELELKKNLTDISSATAKTYTKKFLSNFNYRLIDVDKHGYSLADVKSYSRLGKILLVRNAARLASQGKPSPLLSYKTTYNRNDVNKAFPQLTPIGYSAETIETILGNSDV